MRHERVRFPGGSGVSLAGQIDFPDVSSPVAFALFAHCFTCTKNLRAVGNIDQALTEAGLAVLRFDFTGLGESEGDFADTNFSSNVEDLVAAARFLEKQYRGPRILLGHSLGGAAVLQAARSVESCRAVATIGAPYDPRHVAKLLMDRREEIERHGEAEVLLAGRRFRIKKQFLDDLEQTAVRQRLDSLGRALMIFHSPLDETVGIDNAAEIFMAARHPKSFVSLDRADHLLSREEDSQYVGAVAAAWSRKYLE